MPFPVHFKNCVYNFITTGSSQPQILFISSTNAEIEFSIKESTRILTIHQFPSFKVEKYMPFFTQFVSSDDPLFLENARINFIPNLLEIISILCYSYRAIRLEIQLYLPTIDNKIFYNRITPPYISRWQKYGFMNPLYITTIETGYLINTSSLNADIEMAKTISKPLSSRVLATMERPFHALIHSLKQDPISFHMTFENNLDKRVFYIFPSSGKLAIRRKCSSSRWAIRAIEYLALFFKKYMSDPEKYIKDIPEITKKIENAASNWIINDNQPLLLFVNTLEISAKEFPDFFKKLNQQDLFDAFCTELFAIFSEDALHLTTPLIVSYLSNPSTIRISILYKLLYLATFHIKKLSISKVGHNVKSLFHGTNLFNLILLYFKSSFAAFYSDLPVKSYFEIYITDPAFSIEDINLRLIESLPTKWKESLFLLLRVRFPI